MHLLAGLESPDAGHIFFRGQDMAGLGEDALALWRRREVGIVFQAFHLIPTLSAVENVAFPLYPERMSSHARREKALERLEAVG
ncbi:MAG: ATP-binding cassette domain-containing protein, partial [Chloroflexota bacterium]|nr:ATP-binding cassette domain-containing protein [Chloroflexota bacterium]